MSRKKRPDTPPAVIEPDHVQMSAISELVFLDRYALKDPNKHVKVGDTVVVLVKDDARFPQRDVGVVKRINGDTISVELKETGEVIERDIKKLDRPMETHPSQMWDRMAKAIVEVEEKSKREKLAKDFRWLLDGFRFSPGGRINAMLGTGQDLTAYNCYVIGIGVNGSDKHKDSRQAINDTLGNMVEIMSRGGGVGINLSTLRPRLGYVKGVNGRSSGAVSWGGLYSFATGLVEQGGSRRGALMLILNDWHPDILDFIKAKRDMGAITNANISVGVSNAFMDAVKNDDTWDLIFPDTADPEYDDLWDGNINRWRDEHKKPIKVYDTVRARDVWDTIIESAWISAEPGVVFIERMNEYSNSWYFEDLISTNPCVTGDTLIYTDEGLKRADDLWFDKKPVHVTTDSRLNMSRYLPASEVFATGIKPVYRLKTKEGFEIRLTADHKVMTTNRQWVEAQHLRTGDEIMVLDRPGGFGTEGNIDLGRTLGSFVGSESVDTSVVFQHTGNNVIRSTTNGPQYNVSVLDVEAPHAAPPQSVFPEEIAAKYGLVDGKHQVPDAVMRGSEQMQKGFLQALFTADARVNVQPDNRGAIVLTSVSTKLLQNVQRLLLNFGIYSRIHEDRKADQHRDLRITSESISRFRTSIGFLTECKQFEVDDLVDRYSGSPHKQSFVATFDSLEADGEEMVYDLSVPGLNAFIGNGMVVHNCGEQPLPDWGVCNLAHINLSKFVHNGEVQWDDLKRAARLGVRFLDNIIDVTPYFFEENEKVQKDERRIGMGTLGLGEFLIKLGVRYGSDESIELIDKIYETIATEAYLAGVDLAKEKGSFPKFEADNFVKSKFIQTLPDHVREEIKKHGMRNVCLLTQAPTGSTGTMIGTSTGIEPYYSWTYWRKGRLGMREVQEAIVQQWFDDNPEVERDINNLPDYFVTAMDLEPKDHIKVQAAIQRWTDSSISKTANCPNHYTIEQTKELYEYAYELGCKGVTIYRDGSRDEQVLTQKEDEPSEANDKQMSEVTETTETTDTTVVQSSPLNGSAKSEETVVTSTDPMLSESKHVGKWDQRPQKLTGATYEWPTPLGKAFITINDLDGSPVEMFVNIGKAGSDVAAASEALGRLATLFLKHADEPNTEKKVAYLVDHLSSIGGSSSVGFGENRVTSVPDAMAKSLRKHLEENGSGIQVKVRVRGGLDLCPTCGVAALAREEGCYVCKSCGYTKC